jgi:pyruvate ferredoxin oxidoreductase beta subunit
VSAGYPLDLLRKFEEAKRFRGPKMFLASSPCPTGWHFDPTRSNRYAKLEVDCGLFPLKKAINGKVIHTLIKNHWRPVEDFLRGQGRFLHLFEPVRQDHVIRDMQAAVDEYWMAPNVQDTKPI